MSLLRVVLPFLFLCCSSAAASAQGIACNIIETPGSEANFLEGGAIITATNPVFNCDGGRLRIKAKTANVIRANGQIDLYGNVEVQDTARVLTADQAVFFMRTRKLSATGSALMREIRTGSTIRGDVLTYDEKTPQREARLEAHVTSSRLAQAVLIRESDQDRTRRDTTTLDAQQIIIMGEESFRAIGTARMRRDSLTVTGHDIEFAQAAKTMQVVGYARVTLPRYTLIGDSITARTNDADEIESVLSRHNTRLESEDMNVRAAALRLAFANGGIERMTAMNWPPIAGQPAPPRARVDSPEFHMEADSIDVIAPEQQIREAVAIGNAQGERVTPDSLKRFIPEADPEVAALIANDWMRGDTVRAFFAPNPEKAKNPEASDRIMERLLASGTPAQSMYRMRDEANPSQRMSINYLVASMIEVTFNEGAAELLRASGDAKGVYLQPEEAARRTRVGGTTPGGVRRP